jgi:hypothetical protein
VTGNVVLAVDGTAPTSDACEPITNTAEMAGKIAIVDRGTCTFAAKVKNCQNAGAVAVIVADNAAGSPPAGLGGTDATITIPSVRVTQADGATLKAAIAGGLNVTLTNDNALLAGADAQGRVMLYTPNPFVSGSSLSHWDVSAMPNLLMEPNINSELTSSVDLTRYVFEDIGWLPRTTGVPIAPPTEPAAPAGLALLPNAPNPFAHSTSIRFEVPREADAELGVYDVTGRLVRSLAHDRFPGGAHVVTWDGTDAGGRQVRGGVYFSRLKVDGVVRSQRILLVR